MSAIFYLPYRRVKHWSWESYWIVGGVFSWIVAPWLIASLAVPNLLTTLAHAPGKSVFWSYFFGMLWGIGEAMFGLTVRYLGFALQKQADPQWWAGRQVPALVRTQDFYLSDGASFQFRIRSRRWREVQKL